MILSLRLILLAMLALVVQPVLGRRVERPTTILISIDAFRADYLQRGITPNLQAIARDGVSAVLRPAFPTKTYPNHYAIVTGLLPDRNGIVSNKMRDVARPGELFSTRNDTNAFWWSQAEPIWTAVERSGRHSAVLFWPGSGVPFEGIRPGEWARYDESVTSAQRVDKVLEWLRRPRPRRPSFLALYFDSVDNAGHHSGPDSPQLNAALRDVDRQIGRLRAGLATMHLRVNLIVVSDHGMAPTAPDRVIRLRSIADPDDYQIVEDGAVAMLDPKPRRDAALAASLLKPHPHIRCYRKGDLPARFRYGRNPRVAAFVCLVDVGWMLLDAMPAFGLDVGSHGYDNQAPEMQAIFVAAGPSIRHAGRIPAFDNVAIYPLLRRLIGLPPKPGLDGTIAPFTKVLKR